MTNYLQVDDLTKSFGDRIIFDSINFSIDEGDKIGIVAKNGTGKTTLLRIIAGEDSADSGKIVSKSGLKVAILDQTPQFDASMSVLEACMTAKSEITDAISAYHNALADGDTQKIAEAMQLMDSLNAWEYEDKLKQLLTRFHISDLSASIDTLSGGQLKRVALARVILENPDLIILDEPTNHLDLDIIEWLEDYLTRSRVTLLMVTHDRYFLDRVCNKIIEIDDRQIFTYKGNYDYYLRRRAERIEAMTAELAKVKNTLRREQEWMSRQPQARAGKAKYRIDAFYDLKERSRKNLSERNIELDVNSSYIGNKIAVAHDVSKRYGDKQILRDFNYTFARYEKIGIVGANGVGKSTFIKMLLGDVKPDSGYWELGETLRFGYYSQDGISFNAEKKVIDAITEIADDIYLDDGRRLSPMQFLNKFLFTPADQQKYIHTLSGGEKCRLHLASVLMRSPNFLVLDEPTNDLDIITLGLLEEYLRDFKGCVIVISHDRFFLDQIIDHLFVLEGDGIVKDFPGSYSEFREWKQRRDKELASAEKEVKTAEEPGRRDRADRPKKMTFKERQEFEKLETEIETLIKEKKSLDAIFSSGETIDDIASLSARYDEINSLLDEKELRWLELSEKA